MNMACFRNYLGRCSLIEYEIGMRDHESVLLLEKLRRRICFEWETEDSDRYLSLSEALMKAIQYDHIEMVEYLLKHNMEEATKVSEWSRSHLVVAVDTDRVDIVEKLLQYTMTKKGKSETNTLLRQTLNNLSKSSLSSKSIGSKRSYADRKGGCRKFGTSKSAIHVACKLGRIECLELLLTYGADPSIADHFGFTALEYAIMRLCHGRQIQKIDEPVFDCISMLVQALPNFRLSHYILPRLWQFAEQDLDEEEEEEENAANVQYPLDQALDARSEEEKRAVKVKMQETVREVLGKMSNVRRLEHLCRHRVRCHFVRSRIEPERYDKLPLPKLLNSYIQNCF